MVELAIPKRNIGAGWRLAFAFVAVTGTCVSGFWALADVETLRSAYPAVTIAKGAAMGLFLATGSLCAVIMVWDRLRQSGPESEREISFRAFSDVGMGLGRPLIGNLFYSLLYLQLLLIFLADFLTLVDQQAWLKVGAATPLVLLMAYMPFSRYPALIRDWRRRGAPA